MPTLDHTLSFAIDETGEQLFVHADAEGLGRLIRSLTRIREKVLTGFCEHDHLMTPSWSGHELTERRLGEGVRPIQHVKIYGLTTEWIQKQLTPSET